MRKLLYSFAFALLLASPALAGSIVAKVGGGGSSGGGGAVTQSGTWTMQPGNTPNTIPWLFSIDQTGNNNAVDVLTMPTVTVNSHAVTNAGTFAVQNNAATPAGTNLMGKVGIDQTTPGTTNGVAIISGQAGIAADAGASNALTPRTISASDDPGVLSLGSLEGTILGNAIQVKSVNPNGDEFDYDPPSNYDPLNLTLSTSSQQLAAARTPPTSTRHGMEVQFIGTGYVYCRWGSAATVSAGGYNFRLEPSMPVWTSQVLPNGPPQVAMNCIGSTAPAVSGILVGTEYYNVP